MTALPFDELSDEQVEDYVARNVAAVREVVARARPDVALANHLVMGPAILARALEGTGVPYAVKVHGSALEYTVKPYPRFMPAARAGLAPARGILVGSRHTAESLWAALDDPAVTAKTRLGPPGVDVGHFTPREPEAAAAGLERLRAELAAAPPEADAGSSFARSTAEAAAALGALDPARDRIVVYIGKLIASKGVELLLAAWPLVRGRVPDARLLIVGFGAFRGALEGLATELARGDLDAARALRAEDGRTLPELDAFLDSLGPEAAAYRAAAAGMTDEIHFAGRLDHGELTDVLPVTDAVVDAEHVPRGVRHGRRRGRGLRRVPGRRGPLRHGRGRRLAGRGGRPAGAPVAHLPGRPALGHAAGRGPRELARGAGGAAAGDARADRRRGARALLVGRRRQEGRRGRRGPPRRPPAALIRAGSAHGSRRPAER